MPQPLISAVAQDKFATNASIAAIQSEDRFVATKAFPNLAVNNVSGKVAVYTSADFMRDTAQPVPLGAPMQRGGYDMTSVSYACAEYGISHPVPDQVALNADKPIDVHKAAIAWVTQQLLIRQEAIWAAAAFASSKWTTDLDVSGTVQWDTYATSYPLVQIETGMRTVSQLVGHRPNCAIAGAAVFSALRNHPNVLERTKYTSSKSITREILAEIIGVDELLVGNASYVSTDEGASSDTFADILGKHFLLLYRSKTPSLMTPSGGYTVTWKGGTNNGYGVSVRKWRDEASRAWVYDGSIYIDCQITAADAGYMLHDAVS